MPATIGFGAKLSLDPGTGTFAQIPAMTMIAYPKPDVNMIDASHLNMTTRNREFIPGLTDPGSVSFTCQYTKATYLLLKSVEGIDKVTSAVRWKIEAVDDDGTGPNTPLTATFNGTATSVDGGTLEVEKINEIKFDVKVSGQVTFA